MDSVKELANLKISPHPVYRKVSIIIPVYNERRTIQTIIEVVSKAAVLGLQKEIIIVDDGSEDGTRDILRETAAENIKTIFHEKNLGKSHALYTGFAAASGDIVIVQDADLEYDPYEYELLIKPFLQEKAEVVYGSRYLKSNLRQVPRFWHTFFNKVFTFASNMLSNMYLTDMYTCYKAFNRKVLIEVAQSLQSKRFGFEAEFTAKVARKRYKVIEVPVSYYPRTRAQGKHISFRDALEALWYIVRYNLFR